MNNYKHLMTNENFCIFELTLFKLINFDLLIQFNPKHHFLFVSISRTLKKRFSYDKRLHPKYYSTQLQNAQISVAR